MHGSSRPALALAALLALIAAATFAFAENDTEKPEPPAANTAPPPANPPPPQVTPEITVLNKHEVEGILGRDVRSSADEDMGRIVDVLVDRAGQVRAAIIDFGGFLGVGSRKIVVDWNALHFGHVADKGDSITLELTKEQVNAAPECTEDQPIVVLGAAGSLKPLQFDP
jgi:hypothetical protein